MPALCYLHKTTQASLTRCSQPRVGALGKRSQADEDFIKMIRMLVCRGIRVAYPLMVVTYLDGIFLFPLSSSS